MKILFDSAGRVMPRNAFYNLTPVNQARAVLGQELRVGRPARIEAAANSLLNNTIVSEALQQVIKPLKVFEIVNIDLFVGTSRFKVTPSNAWRKFLFGAEAARRGRPPTIERVGNTVMRQLGIPDPITAAETFIMAMLGMTITWAFFKGAPAEVPKVKGDDDDTEGGIIVENEGNLELATASLSVLIKCDHDQCPDSYFILKTELADYVHTDIETDRLIWACALTRQYQPCRVIDFQPVDVRFQVRFT